MSIEPYAVITVRTPAIMPPKPEAKILAPRWTPEQDAALIRKRANKTWGNLARDSGNSNEQARKTALAKREKVKADILAAIQKSDGLTARGVSEATGATYDTALEVVLVLFRAGQVKQGGQDGNSKIWVRA